MLNAQNLYLQAELTELELDLDKLREKDRAAGQVYHQNWCYLSRSKRDDGGDAQWQKALEIRAKLEEYSRLSLFA